jgi:N-methylhydantoinase A
VLVPSGAGVGSAIGFLRAPVGYEVVRSLYQRFSTFDVAAVNDLLDDMRGGGGSGGGARQLRRAGAETRTAYMRYVGQGHEIPVPLPVAVLGEEDVAINPRTT